MIRILIGSLLMSLSQVVGAAPIDTVLAAFNAEGARPIERVHLFVERNGVADVYYIDRVRPGRFRMLKNPRQDGFELVVIDGAQWLRTTGAWHRSPALMTDGVVPSLTGLFRGGLADAVEQPRPDGGRSVEGRLVWTNGTRCDGKVMLRIDARGLPSLLTFEGDCDGKPSRFRQNFSYDGPLTIAPPE